MWEMQVQSMGREGPWRSKWQPLEYSCLETRLDRGAWQAAVHRVAKSRMTEHAWQHITYFKCVVNSTVCVCVCVLSSVLSNSLQHYGLWPARLLCPWDFPDRNTGVGCHFLCQGIFLTQGSNPYLWHLPHWQADSLPLSHLESWWLYIHMKNVN